MAEEQQTDQPQQEVTIEDVGPARKKLSIEVPQERIQQKIDEAFVELRNDAALPGFRRGRAPRRLIERRFGESIRNDVKGQLLAEAYQQATQENDLHVIGEPDVEGVEDLELPEAGPLKFEVEIEVAPDVDLPPLEELEIEKKKAEVKDEDIDKEIEQVRERFGRMQSVEDDSATVEAGDFVRADVRVLAGEDAGEDAEEISHHPGTYILVPGEDRNYRGHAAGIIIEDLGKRLEGKKPGDVEAISMTGPEGHENEKIKSQPITVRIELTTIERLQPAPVEQLVEQMGVESEDELKQRVREGLAQRAEQQQKTDMHEQILEQLREKVELELPEGLTGRQTERVLQRRRMELMYQGKDEQEVEEAIAEMRSGSEEEARKQLKTFFIVDQAAKDLEVEVGESEVNGQIAALAMRQGRRPEKMRQEMAARGEIEQIYLQIREQKTLDTILEKAKVTEVDKPVTEEAEGE